MPKPLIYKKALGASPLYLNSFRTCEGQFLARRKIHVEELMNGKEP